MPSKKRRINVNATLLRRIDVDTTLFKDVCLLDCNLMDSSTC